MSCSWGSRNIAPRRVTTTGLPTQSSYPECLHRGPNVMNKAGSETSQFLAILAISQ